MSHMHYAVVNRTHVEIRILKPCSSKLCNAYVTNWFPITNWKSPPPHTHTHTHTSVGKLVMMYGRTQNGTISLLRFMKEQ
jgi:hypothetical protein